MSGRARKLVSLLVSATLLGVIYWRVDLDGVLEAFSRSSAVWLVASLGMVVPLTLLTAYRLQWLMPAGPRLCLRDAAALTLSASVLNLVLPSKMGDIAKSLFLREHGSMGGSMALSVVVYEKAWDMVSLLAWCTVGLAFYRTTEPIFWVLAAAVTGGLVALGAALFSTRAAGAAFSLLKTITPEAVWHKVDLFREGWEVAQNRFRTNGWQRTIVVHLSLGIWFLHLVQIWMFTFALRSPVPFLASLGLAPLALLAGLLPLTLAGVGTRDAALILLYGEYLTAPQGAALGVLCTLRYVMPALGGLPFFTRHLHRLQGQRAEAAESPLLRVRT